MLLFFPMDFILRVWMCPSLRLSTDSGVGIGKGWDKQVEEIGMMTAFQCLKGLQETGRGALDKGL